MTALVFVDTNVLIYAVDYSDPKTQQAAKLWRDAFETPYGERMGTNQLSRLWPQPSRADVSTFYLPKTCNMGKCRKESKS